MGDVLTGRAAAQVWAKLESWLARGHWTCQEAVALLSGHYPNQPAIVFLPNGRPLEWKGKSADELTLLAKGRRRALLADLRRNRPTGMDLELLPPATWLELAVKAHRKPRWLSTAVQMRQFHRYFSPALVGYTEEKAASPASSGADEDLVAKPVQLPHAVRKHFSDLRRKGYLASEKGKKMSEVREVHFPNGNGPVFVTALRREERSSVSRRI